MNLKSQLPKPIIKEERVEQIESQAGFLKYSEFWLADYAGSDLQNGRFWKLK